jgi:membrane-associated phospholipid phosphatase
MLSDKNILERNKIFATLARTSPVLILFGAFFSCILQPSYSSFYLLVLIVFTSIFNFGLKNLVSKPIYKLSGKNELPLIGMGSRPKGANSCDLTIDGKHASSFGMPSGHSQIIWTVGIYLLCRIINNNYYKANDLGNTMNTLSIMWLVISCTVIFFVMIYVSYSRVYIEGCHTIQQVIIGGLIGSAVGFIAFYFEDSILKIVKI